MQPRQSASIMRTVFHTRPTEDTEHVGARLEECKVHHLDVDGLHLYFTRPMFDKNKTVYGPAPYNWPLDESTSTVELHQHDVAVPNHKPTAGDRVLIAWVTTVSGGFRPWVLGWSST